MRAAPGRDPDGIPSSASGPGATQTAVFLTRYASWSEIEALRHLSQFEELGGRTVKRILEDNPAALYGLS